LPFTERHMDKRELRSFLSGQFGFLAKSSGEMLWAHHYAVWSVVNKLAHYIPRFRNKPEELELLELAALVHDIGKMNPDWQDAIRNGKTPPAHKASEELIANYLQKYLPNGKATTELIKGVTDIARPHHGPSEKDLKEIDLSGAGFYTQLLTAGDWLASMDTINGRLVAEFGNLFEAFCKLTYAEVGRFPSPTTYVLVKVLDECYAEQNFQPLLFAQNGAVFIGQTTGQTPNPDEVVKRAFSRVIELSLSNQRIKFSGFFGDLLGGISALHPESFLRAKKGEIIEMLKDNSRAPGLFLKLMKDILKNTGRLEEMRKSSPVIDLLSSASGPRGVNLAKKRFKDYFKMQPPNDFNELISQVFRLSIVKEVLPEGCYSKSLSNKRLSSLDSNTLFDLLMELAKANKSQVDPQEQALRNYLSNLLVLEREMDFTTLAHESLSRYCSYKATSNIEKGACERCGCPVAIKPEKGMGFPAGLTKAFSQIKAKPDADRATCVFCAFDNMALRQNIGSGWAPVMLRIDNHIPDLAQNFDALKIFALKMASATRNPKDLKWSHELEETLPFPLPKRLRVPLSDLQEEAQEIVPMGDRGIYFRLSAGERDMSVKDERARFRSLYHLLGLLGFRVSIGEEEQDGLFGLTEVPSVSMYQRSLGALLLASWTKKKERKFLSAEKMLEQQPSVALMAVADHIDRWGGGELSPKIEAFFNSLNQTYLVIAIDQTGKEYKMEELLKDAARLASPVSGIQKFCERPGGSYGWKESKHAAGKPIGQALGEIMRGRSVDLAIATFQRNLRDNIKAEDEDSLKSFLAYVRQLLVRYECLRKTNITEFLRAKNALMSAIYTFTRYPKLMEVKEYEN